MSRRLGSASRGQPVVRIDDNVESYDVLRDGRSSEGRVQQVRIDRIEPSPFQVRRVFPESEIEELAASIRANGLVHEPRGRPHPSRPGWVELMPGEMRLRALKRLVERGEAEGVLQQDPEGNWLAPIRVDPVEDDRAEAIVMSENKDRTDLSPWEWALAWRQRRESLRRRGQPSGVRDVAESLGEKFQTVGEYLRVAEAITVEVLASAGVMHGGEIDHGRMAQLPLAALLRVAQAVATGAAAGAERLLQELSRAGDRSAAGQLTARQQAKRVEASGFQINIRQALGELAPQQASRYLDRIAPALDVLVERALPQLDAAEADRLATAFHGLAQRLRRDS